MNTLSKVTILVIITILSGCAGMGAQKVLELEDNQKILVISSMGNEFDLLSVGTTVFSNESKSIPVNGWYVDDHIEKSISELSEKSRFDIKSQEILPLKNPPPVFMTSLWTLQIDFNGIKDHIFSFAKEKEYDLILFVNSFEDEDTIFGTNQYYSGYGLYKRTFLSSSRTVIYARVSVNLYDVNTQKKVTGTWDTISRPCSDYISYEKLSSLTDKQISDNEKKVKSLIKESIIGQLKELNIL